ncbi:MAG: hypothetical protein A3G30_01020 [Chlamydiae bacterium RIFCSPLOWO2_12_FULL_49_12]|nr:MAG: hypothetical protein A3G30_01020 [Chlamydiae bacterium RIFCSPLOWO2_12_FULL_49_12]
MGEVKKSCPKGKSASLRNFSLISSKCTPKSSMQKRGETPKRSFKSCHSARRKEQAQHLFCPSLA